MVPFIALFLAAICGVQGLYYDSYHAAQLSEQEYNEYVKVNTTYWCTNQIEPCDPNKGRRIDGSCNNLDNPSRGASNTPFIRLLPAEYSYDNVNKEFESKKTKSGQDMPPPRYLRTRLMASGSVPNQIFTQLPTYFLLLLSGDVVSLQDTTNYIFSKPYCCEAKGKTDRFCVPNKLPDDDPVHRFSNIRCLNLTRPVSFQSNECISNTTVPERASASTPMIDLSIIYGSRYESLNEKGRKFEGGLLKYEVEDGRIWPPSMNTTPNACAQNVLPAETRCHDTPVDAFNGIAGLNLMSLWFWRLHNDIAMKLGEINPCWDDEQLFMTARDINIAIVTQILYYELSPVLFGRENLERDGVISNNPGFRDRYNKDMPPRISLEFPYILRWVHTMQEGALRMYDKDGYYLKTFPMVNLTLRTGYFAIDDNIDGVTQGSFRQGCAGIDFVADADVVEVGMGNLQKALDILTNDLTKNTLFGFPPYIKYRELCSGESIKSFDDLIGTIDPERIESLKNVYGNVEDIDLLAGTWIERPMEGGAVAPTFYCIVMKQLVRNIVSDRHWYERPNRPDAFTSEQLQEIRKASIARVLCDIGDSVTHIQPNAFLRPGPDNRIGSCDEIEKIDLNAWTDQRCCQENNAYENK